MFSKENRGLFGRDPLGMGAPKKVASVLKSSPMFSGETGFSDPLKLGAPRSETAIPLFVRNLKKLASHPGIVDRFHSGIIEYSLGKALDPEIKRLLELGKSYHGRGLRRMLEGLTSEDGVKVPITIPKIVKGENGKRRVFPGVALDSESGRLIAIVSARRNEVNDVIFEAVAVVDGEPLNRKHVSLVGIHSQTGQVFFHPDFLPGMHHKKVDQVVPPTIAHKLFPQERTLKSGKPSIGFFK